MQTKRNCLKVGLVALMAGSAFGITFPFIPAPELGTNASVSWLSLGGSCADGGTIFASATCGHTASAVDGDFTGLATAHANYGVLAAYATGTLAGGTATGFTEHLSDATARYQDILTLVPGPSVTIGAATVVFHFHVDGTTSAAGAAVASGSLQVLNGFQGNIGLFTLGSGGATVDTTPDGYTWGAPYALEATLSASVEILNPFSGAYNASGTADFAHTVVFTGVSVFDKFHNPLTDFQIVDAAVPEPGTLSLALLGAGLAAFHRRRAMRLPAE